MKSESLTDQLRLLEEEIMPLLMDKVYDPIAVYSACQEKLEKLLAVAKGLEDELDECKEKAGELDGKTLALEAERHALSETIAALRAENERQADALTDALNTLNRIAKLTGEKGEKLYEGGCSQEAQSAIVRINGPAKYYAIWSPLIRKVVGVTTEAGKNDVDACDELRPITKEEYDAYCNS